MALTRKEHNFDIIIDGKLHNINFYRKNGKYYLNIDGELKETYRPPSFLSILFDDINDYTYVFLGNELVLAVRSNKTRLAINGTYTDSEEDFVAVRPLPKWSAVFIIAILLPPIFLKVQMPDVFICIMLTYMCTHHILKNPDIKASDGLRFLYCVLITLASWLLLWVFNYM